jgi:hypothetical protein
MSCFFNLPAKKKSHVKQTHSVVLINSIPKCGTHLVQKCIELLTGKKQKWIGTKVTDLFFTGNDFSVILHKLKSLDSKHYMFSHLTYSNKLAQFLTHLKYHVFFVYRDPRGQVASLAKWWIKMGHGIDGNLNETILSLLQESRLYQFRWQNITDIKTLYLEFMPWALNPNFCTVRFEDLVGEQGGGSAEKQFETVRRIAKYLGLKRTTQEIQFICNQLFGGTSTFSQGQIDGWKAYFTGKHKRIFKKIAGNLLIELEYEKDNNW